MRVSTPMCIRIATAVVAVAALFLGVTGAKATVFGAKEMVLGNGMRVVVIENHRAPVVTQMLWYKAGAIDEPPGKSGISHFLEHLMFKGTKTTAPGEFSATVSRHGGRDNAFTSQDYVGYVQSVASDRLEMIVRLEAGRMRNLVLTEDVFTPEKQVVLEERAQRTENSPGALLGEQAGAALYLNHPYRIPIIGWRHEIEALTLQDALDFYDLYYAPNNAVLVVAGDVEANEVFALASRYYGEIAPSNLPERPDWAEPPSLGKKTISYSDPRVRQSSWSLRKLAPSYLTGASEHVYALQVLMDLLGGGSTSRLYRSLVIDQGIAVSAGGWYDPSKRGPGQIGFWAQPSPGQTLDTVAAGVHVEIDRLLAEGVTQDEVRKSITRLQDAAATAMDSLGGPARVIGEALVIGRKLVDVEAWPARIGSVTIEDVNAAARAVLGTEGSIETRLLPISDENEGDPS